jgi:hypothetical protein
MDNCTVIIVSKIRAATAKTEFGSRWKFLDTKFMNGRTGADNSERTKTLNQPIAYRKLSLPSRASRTMIETATEVPMKINME